MATNRKAQIESVVAIILLIALVFIAQLMVGVFGVAAANVNSSLGSGTRSFLPHGDVVVIHSNGHATVYNSSSPHNNVANGLALVAATQAMQQGDSIYLRAETYNMIANSISMPNYGNIYGAGKYKTIILSNFSSSYPIISEFTNDTVSDLSLIGTLQGANLSVGPYQEGIGVFSSNVSNDIVRNVYVNSSLTAVNFQAGTMNNIRLYNLTVTANNTGIVFDPSNPLGQMYIFDTNVIVQNGNYGDTFEYGIFDNAGTISVINSNAYTLTGTLVAFGQRVMHESLGTANLYAGSYAGTSGHGSVSDLFNNGGTLAVNATVIYNPSLVSGTINSISGGFGPYTYQKFPMNVPLAITGGVSQAQIQFGQVGNANSTIIPFITVIVVVALVVILLDLLGVDIAAYFRRAGGRSE
jgi:hypothetical protein